MIKYDENSLFREVVFRREGSVCGKSACFAFVSVMFNLFLLLQDDISPGARQDFGLLDMSEGQIWNASFGLLAILLGFRTKQALGRFWEGTGLLHQIRGEWFDSVACLFAFSRAAKDNKQQEVDDFRHILVRLMSFCHCAALEEIGGDSVKAKYDVVDISGLSMETLTYLRVSKAVFKFNRVEVLLHMIQVLVTQALDDGVLRIPPPILSRVYQTLSRGFVNELNSKKITDTLFPFPYTQVMTYLLFLHMLMTPIMISSVVANKLLSSLIVFTSVFGMFAVNFVAQELENPFGDDDNDLPLAHFQEEMNNSLMMLMQPDSDHKATLSNICIVDFNSLNKLVVDTRQSQAVFTRPDSIDLTDDELDIMQLESNGHFQSNSCALDDEDFFAVMSRKIQNKEKRAAVAKEASESLGLASIGSFGFAASIPAGPIDEVKREASVAETSKPADAAQVEPADEISDPLSQKAEGKPIAEDESIEKSNEAPSRRKCKSLVVHMEPEVEEPRRKCKSLVEPETKIIEDSRSPTEPEAKQNDLEPKLARSMDDLNKLLNKSMDEFHSAQNRWIEMIRDQVNVLRQNSDGQYRWTENVKEQVTVLCRNSDALDRIADKLSKPSTKQSVAGSSEVQSLLEGGRQPAVAMPQPGLLSIPPALSPNCWCTRAPSVRYASIGATEEDQR